MRTSHFLAIAVAVCTLALSPKRLHAQGFGGEDRVAGFMMMRYDLNRNGQLDPDEIDQMPESMLDVLEDNGYDLSRPISREDFLEVASELMQAMRSNRMSGGDRGGFGGDRGGFGGGFGGDRGGFGGDRGGFGGRGRGGFRGDRESGEGRDGGRGRGRGGWGESRNGEDGRSDGRTSRGSASNGPAPRPRVTIELPEKYRHLDTDGDGQIGLYEWGRAGYAQFVLLDRNGDGFLSPRELVDPPADVVVQVPAGTGSSATVLASSSSNNAAPGVSASRSDASNNSRRTSQSGRSRTSSGTTTGSSAPAASSTADSEEEEEDVNVKNARTLFTALDVDKDGSLTEEEWNRSRLARQQFQAAGVELGLPVSLEQFTVKYVEMKSKN